MNLDTIITLAKAGYTADQINQMLQQPIQQPVQQPVQQPIQQPIQQPVQNYNDLAAMRNEIAQLRAMIQLNNTQTATITAPPVRTSDDVVANLINPPDVMQLGQNPPEKTEV